MAEETGGLPVPPCEDQSDGLFDLSLSLGEKSYGNVVQYQRKEHDKMNNNHLKPKLSLSLGGGYFELSKRKSHGEVRPELESFKVGAEYSNQYLKNSSSKKRKRVEYLPSSTSSITRKVSSSRNKRIQVSIELRLGPDPRCIKKELTTSDLNSNSRLLLPLDPLEKHLFPFWNRDQLGKIEDGLLVSVWDVDTKTANELVFQQWNKGGANVFKKNWNKDFVKRRNLKVNDVIGLYWDQGSSRLNFSVLKS